MPTSAVCGNGAVEAGEEYDDGNDNNFNDGCLDTCEKCAAPGLRVDIYGGVNQQCCDGLILQSILCNVPPAATPEAAIETLIGDIESLDLPGRFENRLSRKLERALSSLERGNVRAAVKKIRAFINHVKAQRGKKLTPEQVAALIAKARAILAMLQ